MKEILGRAKSTKGSFPNCFNQFSVDIGLKLASMIPKSQTKFDDYLNLHQTFMGEANLAHDKLKEALRRFKPKKS